MVFTELALGIAYVASPPKQKERIRLIVSKTWGKVRGMFVYIRIFVWGKSEKIYSGVVSGVKNRSINIEEMISSELLLLLHKKNNI